MGARRGWTGRAVACVLIAVAAAAARTAEPLVEGPKEPKETVDDPRQAALRLQQIEAQAAQMKRFFEPAVQAELERVRRICGDLEPEVRGQVVAAANEAAITLARQFAERSLQGKDRQRLDPAGTVHDAVAKAIEPHVSAEQFANYAREHEAHVARRLRAARLVTVDRLDRQLGLSVAQRSAIGDDLAKAWQAAWPQPLDDRGARVGNVPFAPDFAEACITPHLDERQWAVWKTWCEQAGAQRTRAHARVWNFDGDSMQPDSWWTLSP